MVIAFSCLVATVAHAKEYYVSDQLTAPLRASASESARITRMLPSGTKLEQIGASGQHIQVRHSGGTGWIHRSFVMDEPVARELVKEAKEKLAEIGVLEENIKTLEAEVETLRGTIEKLTLEKDELGAKYAQLAKVSTQAVEIDRRNTELSTENYNLEVRYKALDTENRLLKDNSRSRQWMIGAGILFAGIIFGSIIMPSIVTRLRMKRNSWDL